MIQCSPWGVCCDAGKQVSLLTAASPSSAGVHCGIRFPSSWSHPIPIEADVKLSIDEMNVALKGPQTEAQLRRSIAELRFMRLPRATSHSIWPR